MNASFFSRLFYQFYVNAQEREMKREGKLVVLVSDEAGKKSEGELNHGFQSEFQTTSQSSVM